LVEEEIDLVVSSQMERGDGRFGFEDFVARWGWHDKLQLKVVALSGGWRKLLGLSLFLNRRCSHVLIVDFASHLSDGSMLFVIDRMRDLDMEAVAFAEYDPMLLLRHLPDALILECDV
jgi:hypothetical protein